MKQISFKKEYFFANYFWSVKDGYLISEDILAKKYLENYFTFGDIVTLYFLIGKDSLLAYAKELNMEKRILKLIDKIELKLE